MGLFLLLACFRDHTIVLDALQRFFLHLVRETFHGIIS